MHSSTGDEIRAAMTRADYMAMFWAMLWCRATGFQANVAMSLLIEDRIKNYDRFPSASEEMKGYNPINIYFYLLMIAHARGWDLTRKDRALRQHS